MKLYALKSAKNDFTQAQLPHNRREVFWDVVRLHWKSLLLMGFLVLLFTVPLHYVGIFRQIQTTEIMKGFETASLESRQESIGQVMFLHNTCALWEIPCMVFLSVCLSGLLRVIRQYAWLENVYFRSDFFVGIRQNIGQSLLLALLTGLVSFGVQWCANLSAFQESSLLSLALSAPLFIAALCGIPTAAYAAAVLPVYDGGLFRKIRVGMYLLAKNPLKTLGALTVCLLPLGLYLLPNLLLHTLMRVLYSLLVPFIMLGWFLFASNRLDAHVYPEKYPHLVGRGVFSRTDGKER